MRKYIFLVVLLLLVGWSAPGISHADTAATHINLDGHELIISTEAQVQIVNGSVMVPLRLVAEQLGYTVKWDNITKTATIEQAGTMLKLVLNNPTADAAGRPVKLDNPPFLSGNVTLVPLRFVSEETGTKVGWDNNTKTVMLSSPVKVPEQPIPPLAGSETTLTDLSFSDNKLTIKIQGTVTPSVFAMTAKDRIVVDLPNTSFSESFVQSPLLSNKQNGTMIVNGSPDVTSIRYSLFSTVPSTIRIVLDLNSAKTYNVTNANNGLVIIDLNGNLPVSTPDATIVPVLPIATPTPVITASAQKLVVIDAGHGGKDPGGISLNKHNEKDFTLSTVLKIQKLMEKEPNLKVVLTRSDDRYPTLQDRAKVANDLRADLFVSIHANSIPAGSTSNPSGTETYYTRKDSLAFAQTIHKYLVPATGLSDRGVRQSSLYVTRETHMPAILLECGFLSNAKDESLMYSEDFQQRVAEAVVSGIKEYLGM